jgi:bifunctional DNA-binding transcriptional regulator/antitoxin component of YhaV-PrlF toxin-antitoxin module
MGRGLTSLAIKASLPSFAPVPQLTLASKGQVTIRKEVLAHLGVEPGGKVEVDMLPGGEVVLRAAVKGDIRAVFAMSSDYAGLPVSIEKMDEAIAAGGAGER